MHFECYRESNFFFQIDSGHSPRLPNVYVADTTKPALVKWFVDYDQARLFFVFTEPVQLLDCTAISFSFSSGFNFSMNQCTTEYMEFGTTIVYRLLDDGVETCEASSVGHNSDEDDCNIYTLSFTPHSTNAVTQKLLKLRSDPDEAFLSISANALIDYAETPNYSDDILSVGHLGPGE